MNWIKNKGIWIKNNWSMWLGINNNIYLTNRNWKHKNIIAEFDNQKDAGLCLKKFLNSKITDILIWGKYC